MNTVAQNGNADTIESGLAEALSRSNSTDNAMESELDMGGNDITNVGSIEFVSHTLISYTVATLPSATTVGQMIYVTDETGGAVPAFSDGTNFRRVTDRAVVS
jgi:hypothetical protein